MNYKKKFPGMMVVALIATAMSVGFMSCNKDGEKKGVNYTYLSLIGKWSVYPGLESLFSIEFKKDSTYYYVNPNIGSGSGNGNCRVFDTQETQYMDVIESYLKVYSTIVYYEYDNGTFKTWEIVDGNIIYIDGIPWGFDWAIKWDIDIIYDGAEVCWDSLRSSSTDYYNAGRILFYTLDSTVIVTETTPYDAHLFKMHASGNKSFDQIWVYYIIPDYENQIVVEFYSNNALLAQDRRKWYSKNN